MFRKPSLEVEVEPTVLQWAVETSGWAHAEIAKKLKIRNIIYYIETTISNVFPFKTTERATDTERLPDAS